MEPIKMAAGAVEIGGGVVEIGGLPSVLNVEKQIERVLANNKQKIADEAGYLAATLRECGSIGFGQAEPAHALMERFLRKSGQLWEFDLTELFTSDAGAKARVYSEVIRRTLRLLTYKEKIGLATFQGKGVLSPLEQRRLANLPVPGTGVLKKEVLDAKLDTVIDPVVTIFQKNFKNAGWWGALGTFPITFEVTGKSSDGAKLFGKLGGENAYDWHPGDKQRSTQRIHQIAARLIEIGAAKAFTMRAKPRTFVIDVRSQTIDDVALIQTEVQSNPDNSRGKRLDQMMRLVKTYF